MLGYGKKVRLPIDARSGLSPPRMRLKAVGIVLSVLMLAFGSMAVAGVVLPEAVTIVQCDPNDVAVGGHEADPGHSHSRGHHHCPQVNCGAWMVCPADAQPVPDRSVDWAAADPRSPAGIGPSHAEPPPRA